MRERRWHPYHVRCSSSLVNKMMHFLLVFLIFLWGFWWFFSSISSPLSTWLESAVKSYDTIFSFVSYFRRVRHLTSCLFSWHLMRVVLSLMLVLKNPLSIELSHVSSHIFLLNLFLQKPLPSHSFDGQTQFLRNLSRLVIVTDKIAKSITVDHPVTGNTFFLILNLQFIPPSVFSCCRKEWIQHLLWLASYIFLHSLWFWVKCLKSLNQDEQLLLHSNLSLRWLVLTLFCRRF